jgi:predicted PurR-regulated permease PerM
MTRVASAPALKVFRVAAIFLSITLAVAILYFAKVVLIPVALAVLLTFVLSPVVTHLDHRGVWRVPAVLLAVGLAGLLLAGLTWIVGSQLGSLANDLPNYRENIREKVAALRQGTQGGLVEKVQSTLETVRVPREDLEARTAKDGAQPANVQGPIAVRVVPDEGPEKALSTVLTSLSAVSPALEGLATGAFALILVIFMLINREDLRNRLVSFAANGNLAKTTKALDDAGQRISRYLTMQLIINGSYGLVVGISLLLIGVPYALLWGLCATVFRYVPYIGPWIGALLPISISVITSPGWSQVLLVIGVFLVLELISNNVMEPWLYGQGVGISVVALLISAAFWTWIWGPIGLILATPLTVCLVVVGKHVPDLSFLDRLLGDRPALQPYAGFLQRLLARDDHEAAEIVRKYRKEHPPETVYDEVLVPALALARQDRTLSNMDAEEEAFVVQATRSILEEISPSYGDDASCANMSEDDEGTGEVNAASTGQNGDSGRTLGSAIDSARKNGTSDVPPPLATVLGCPAHLEAEELTLQMLHQLTAPAGVPVEFLSTRMLPSDVVQRVKQLRPAAVVIAILPPGGFAQTRYLCKLLRKQFPELPIVIGCWGYTGNLDRIIVKLRSAGSHHVMTTLLGVQGHIVSLVAPLLQRTDVASKPEPQVVSSS